MVAPAAESGRNIVGMTKQPFLEITVYGTPQPAGSKISEPVRRKGGEIVTKQTPRGPEPMLRTRDDNKKAAGWKLQIGQVAAQYIAEPHDGPIYAHLRFYRARPKTHFKANGALKEWAVAMLPTTKPDVDKMSRAVLDGLSGIAYGDDAQVTRKLAEKFYGTQERVVITLYPADAFEAIAVAEEEFQVEPAPAEQETLELELAA